MIVIPNDYITNSKSRVAVMAELAHKISVHVEQAADVQRLYDSIIELEQANVAHGNHPHNSINQMRLLELENSKNWAIYKNAIQLASLLLQKFPLTEEIKDEINLLTQSVNLAVKLVNKVKVNDEDVNEAERIINQVAVHVQKDNVSPKKQQKWGALLIGLGVLGMVGAAFLAAGLVVSLPLTWPLAAFIIIPCLAALTLFSASGALAWKGVRVFDSGTHTIALNKSRTMFHEVIQNRIKEDVVAPEQVINPI